MSSSLPLVPVVTTPVVAPIPAPTVSPLSATQLATVCESVKTVLTGTSSSALLSQLPAACVQVYQDIVQIYDASPAAQQALVVQILESVVGMLPGIPATELAIIDQVIATLVPKFLSYLPQIEAGIIKGFQDVEVEAKGCCTWFKSKCC